MIHVAPAWYGIAALAVGWMLVRKYQRDPLLMRKTATAPVATPATTPVPATRNGSWNWLVYVGVLAVILISAYLFWKPVTGLFHASDSTERVQRLSVPLTSMPARAHALADNDLPITSTSTVDCGGSGTLALKAHADSRPFYTPGCYVTFTGANFTEQCFYQDGTLGIVGDLAKPCHDGPMRKQQIHNDLDDDNFVSYVIHR